VDDRFVQVHVVRSARGGNKHDEYQDKVTQWTNALFGEKGEGYLGREACEYRAENK